MFIVSYVLVATETISKFPRVLSIGKGFVLFYNYVFIGTS